MPEKRKNHKRKGRNAPHRQGDAVIPAFEKIKSGNAEHKCHQKKEKMNDSFEKQIFPGELLHGRFPPEIRI